LARASSADALAQRRCAPPTVTDRLSAEVLAASRCAAGSSPTTGVGFNHIDTTSAKARGLVVTNTPDVLTDDTRRPP